MTAAVPARTLNTGHQIPLLGLGTYPMNGESGAAAMTRAISMGYRLLDTAAKYENEAAVGEAIRRSGVGRAELFVTTKLRGAEHGRAETRVAVHASLERLGLDYLDLYLIHWPLPMVGRFVESYETMLELAAEGLIRSAGVSNFAPAHITALLDATGVAPAVNQIELSPALARTDTRKWLDAAGVVTQAWSPLGLDHRVPEAPAVIAAARAHDMTPAQVILRWEVQQGIVAIPKSADEERQRANLDVFGFELTDNEMAALAGLDLGEAAAVDADAREEY
ncbi:MAG TPA: aldo/keto reductase [Streptosporangiaceae bacterium]|nr:aldo/keto reductase [Streptosporangiaceae bacterium]